ncbi:Soluble secreted antigen MPT53 precursor [Actinokineospora sp. UTMC 2448]|nr:Soluble secreted antigen MPT53 precursor [Actinokineospora sp. UTMC 2448]
MIVRMWMKRALGAAAIVLVTTACGQSPDNAAQPGPTTGTTTTATAAPSGTTAASDPVVPEKLRFSAKTVGGGTFEGASLAGKPAVLWFWAPWCPKCQREASGIAAAAERSEVAFVGVAANDTEGEMRRFIDERGVGGFPHLADEQAEVWAHFGVAAQPAYAFISSAGEVEVVTAQLTEQELMAKVAGLT